MAFDVPAVLFLRRRSDFLHLRLYMATNSGADDAALDNGDTMSEGTVTDENAGTPGNTTGDTDNNKKNNDGTVSGELGNAVKDVGDGVGDAVEDVGDAVGNAVEGR